MNQTVLAIDASTEGCSVALRTESECYSQISIEPRTHAQRLLPMIDSVLAEAKLDLSAVDRIALVNGPGSFTGIRIALSVVQGLAYGANIPVVCVSSLVVMAHSFQDQCCTEGDEKTVRVAVALDARMSEVYWAVYEFRAGASMPIEIAAPAVGSATQLIDWLQSKQKENIATWGVGNGFGLEQLDSALCAGVDSSIGPQALSVLSYIEMLASNSEKNEALNTMSAHEIEPLYLRNEVAWKKRTRIRKLDAAPSAGSNLKA